MASTALHCGGDSWELASATSTIHGYNHEPSQRQSSLVSVGGAPTDERKMWLFQANRRSVRQAVGRLTCENMPARCRCSACTGMQAGKQGMGLLPATYLGQVRQGRKGGRGAGRKGRPRLIAKRNPSPSSHALTGGWLLPCLG